MCALYNRIECTTQTALQMVVISQYIPLFLRSKMFCNSEFSQTAANATQHICETFRLVSAFTNVSKVVSLVLTIS
jgi:predicted dinucleotide-binding enzyme